MSSSPRIPSTCKWCRNPLSLSDMEWQVRAYERAGRALPEAGVLCWYCMLEGVENFVGSSHGEEDDSA